jgi:predicted AAA+ superfamily ATPase
MPHDRNRLALQIIKKRLKFFPILAIQGARQTGKSFLVKKILAPSMKASEYITLDDETMRNYANESPKTFLTENEKALPLIIDEAQKAPPLFDALKFLVDQKKLPGKFVILGSTEFSKQTLIREPLTGRMGKIRIFPLSIRETLERNNAEEITQSEILKYIKNGGLPGICFVRDTAVQNNLFQDWIELTCYRDIQQFNKLKLEGELAFRILQKTAQLEEPTLANISKSLKVNPKKIKTHLESLKQLFVIYELQPHPSGTGKPIFIPFDCGIANYFNADRIRLLQIFLLNEKLIQDAYSNEKRSLFFYYRSTGKKMIHLIEETAEGKTIASQIITHETIKKPDSELMKAFLIKNKKASGKILGPVSKKITLNTVQYYPWSEF